MRTPICEYNRDPANHTLLTNCHYKAARLALIQNHNDESEAAMSTRHRNMTLLVDFDGTIVNIDTAQVALDRFGDPDWFRIDEALERGEVSFEESLRVEFAMLKAPPDEIIKEVSRVTALRPNFDRLVKYCKTNNVPLTVVSGGLDFCIRHFLDRDEWRSFVEICAPTSSFTGSGYTLTFPKVPADESTNFKDGLVKHEKSHGRFVVFIGNGFGDLAAAKEAHLVFAIKHSRLAELCREQDVPYEEIEEFGQVVDALNRRFRENE
jgi:2,3-diketo-5-methylthio-1-phosphopentane phosphatase